MDKSVFRMSEAGGCQLAMAARKLGYEPLPESKESQTIMEEASEDEFRVKRKLISKGLSLCSNGSPVTCTRCGAGGYHVEIETELVKIVGHLDDYIYTPHEKMMPLEIKNLGRFSWNKFHKSNLEGFPEYKAQFALYLEASHSLGGVYITRCRDHGLLLIYTVGEVYPQLVEKLRVLGEVTQLPMPDINSVLDKIHYVQLLVESSELPPAEFAEGTPQCSWCRWKYLCSKEEKEEAKKVTEPNLLEAAAKWREGKELATQGEAMKEEAQLAFLNHAKTNKIDKYRVGGVSVSYLGEATRQFIDDKLLKEIAPDVFAKVAKRSKPWDDIRIRLLKEVS